MFQIVKSGSPAKKGNFQCQRREYLSTKVKIVFPYHSVNTVFRDKESIKFLSMNIWDFTPQSQKRKEKNRNQHRINPEYENTPPGKCFSYKVF